MRAQILHPTRTLDVTLESQPCIEADVGSAEMEGATSDVLPSYK